MNTSSIVQKLWNYCNVLRDDGMSYGDYVEQLTYLLFLKMVDERTRPPHRQPGPVPEQHAWSSQGTNRTPITFLTDKRGCPRFPWASISSLQNVSAEM